MCVCVYFSIFLNPTPNPSPDPTTQPNHLLEFSSNLPAGSCHCTGTMNPSSDTSENHGFRQLLSRNHRLLSYCAHFRCRCRFLRVSQLPCSFLLRLGLNVMEMAQIWSHRKQQSLLKSKTLPPCFWHLPQPLSFSLPPSSSLPAPSS